MNAADRGSQTQLPISTLWMCSLSRRSFWRNKQNSIRALPRSKAESSYHEVKRIALRSESEKYDRDLQQLELRLEDLEANQAGHRTARPQCQPV